VGTEAAIAARVARHREAQVAVTLDADTGAPPEILTFSPADRAFDRWLTRTIGGLGERLNDIRECLFADAQCQRHFLVLDLTADTGLLTWEAVRQTPEGGVWSLVSTPAAEAVLRAQARHCPELRTPQPLCGPVEQVGDLLDRAGAGDVRFDLILGRNAIGRLARKNAVLAVLGRRLRPGGLLALAETLTRRTQRLYRLVDLAGLGAELAERLAAAEEAIYADPADARVNWDVAEVEQWLRAAGFAEVRVRVQEQTTQQVLPQTLLDRWFAEARVEGRPSYAQHLRRSLSPDELARVRELYVSRLAGQTVHWSTALALVGARTPG
jgi:putative ATPase